MMGNGAGKRSEADRYWQAAGDRVFLYLRCLNFPAPQALELALGVLKAAERSMGLGYGNSPVSEAMQALHQALSEQKPDGRSHSLTTRYDCLAPPPPPLRRRSMVAEEMVSAHWRSLVRQDKPG
jgi:hypothetical protein